MRLLALPLIALIAACGGNRIAAHTEYFNQKSLASTVVGTPDPRKDLPYYGERLVISWHVDPADFVPEQTAMTLQLQFTDATDSTLTFPLPSRSGDYIYALTGPDYTQSGGIMSYHAAISNGQASVATTQSKLWVTRIVIPG